MKEEEILDLLETSLLKDISRIEKRLAIYEDDDDKVSKLTSAKQRQVKSLLDVLSMKRDPRFTTMSEPEKKDIARMISLLKEGKEKKGAPNAEGPHL